MNNLTVSQAMQEVANGKVVEYKGNLIFLDNRQFHMKVRDKLRLSSNADIYISNFDKVTNSLYYDLTKDNRYEFNLFGKSDEDIVQ